MNLNLLKGILSSLKKKIDRMRCIVKCAAVKENKNLDILDEMVGI